MATFIVQVPTLLCARVPTPSETTRAADGDAEQRSSVPWLHGASSANRGGRIVTLKRLSPSRAVSRYNSTACPPPSAISCRTTERCPATHCSTASWTTSPGRGWRSTRRRRRRSWRSSTAQNVILNTPTGSGKSLVASSMLFARARARRARRLHLPDQGAGQREVDGALPRVRPRVRGALHRRRLGEPRRADPVLHRRGAGEHRPARGRRRRRGSRRDGRVPLLRRSRSRRGLADAAADDAADAVPADVGDARRHHAVRARAHRA